MDKEAAILTREILLAFWKIHILYHAGKAPVYGQWIVTELRRHGYDISPGTLYPLLKRMEQHGWLQRNAEGPGPKSRQFYTITPSGKRILEQIQHQIQELYGEVIEDK